MIRFLEKVKNLSPLIFLILIIVFPWFLKRGYLFFVDMSWGPHITIPEWTSNWFYFWVIIKILNFLIPADFLEKIFIVIVFGVVLFGGYKLGQSLTKIKTISFLSSAFSLFNPFVYDRVMYGQFGVVLGYGFFLAFFAYLIKYYFDLNEKLIFFAGLFAGLSILFSPHFIFFILLVYLVLGTLIVINNLNLRGKLFNFIKYSFLFFFIIIVINFNWLYGLFSREGNLKEFIEQEITEKDFLIFKTRGSNSFEIVKNVFLMSGFWGAEQFRYIPLKEIKPIWSFSFYLILIIIIWGLFSNFKDKEKRKLIFSLIFIFFISFVLAIGVALPIFAEITFFLSNYLPFYKGLRESQKWVAVIVTIYNIFFVYGLIELFKKEFINRNENLRIFLLVFLTWLIIFQAPLLINGTIEQIKPTNYPSDWNQINELIVEDSNCQKKILFLPWHLYMYFKWIGNIVVNPAPRFFTCPVIYGENMEFGGIYTQSLKPEQKKVENWLISFGNTDLLSRNDLNIGYIILAKEADWQKYLWVEKIINLKILKETENLKVYKVEELN